MARGHTRKPYTGDPQPKRAFSDGRIKLMHQAICQLYHRAIAYKPMDLPWAQAWEIFINPEHKQLIAQAKELFSVSGAYRFQFKPDLVNAPRFDITQTGNAHEHSFPFPSYIGGELFVPKGHPELAGLVAWCDWRARTDLDFRLTAAVFDELLVRCKTPAQIAFFWPAVGAVLHQAGYSKDADKLNSQRTPQGVPAICMELRDACRYTGGVVTKALLLMDPNKQSAPSPVQLSVGLTGMGDHPCLPWALDRVIPTVTPEEAPAT